MASLPTVITSAGLQPQLPSSLLAQLLSSVAATNPGYTANLPGSLIEDISSTDVAAIALCDSFRVELVNSLTPFGANPFLMNQLGQIYGVVLGQASNTSVYVVFSGPAGFVIAQGFVVSDGTYQYTVQDGGIIASSGTSQPLFCLATIAGSWAVPAGTVTNLVTSVPSSISLTVTNPETGTPGIATGETQESYRARVLQAGLAASQGMARYLKTLLANVPGVQPRLISVVQQSGGGWQIICGGGDPYEVAYAIYTALFDVSTLVGSQLLIAGITTATLGVVQTTLNHGFTTGQIINIAGVNPSGFNATGATVTVIDETHFTYGLDTAALTYISGGIVTPNLRNVSVTINDYPDTYVIPFVNPPEQQVAITVTWNTTSTNSVSPAAISQLANPALVAYVNSVYAGQPMNLFELQTTFQAAIASALPPQLLTRMVFAVSINGIGVSPESGTGIIAGDPSSYFFTNSTLITVSQG
jgi:hypothetical protein